MTRKIQVKLLTTRREITVRREAGNASGYTHYCEECASETVWLTPNAAATISRTTEREIFRGAETGDIHVATAANGHSLICERSLMLHSNSRDTTGEKRNETD